MVSSDQRTLLHKAGELLKLQSGFFKNYYTVLVFEQELHPRLSGHGDVGFSLIVLHSLVPHSPNSGCCLGAQFGTKVCSSLGVSLCVLPV